MPVTDAERRELELRRELQQRQSRTPEEAAQWEERYRRQEARAADTRTPAERMKAARETVFQEAPGYEKLARGIAKPFAETAIGGRALVEGGLTPAAAGQLRELQGVSGGYGTTGEVLGNVAMFAAPGGAATRGVTKGVSLLPKALAKYGGTKGAQITAGGMASTGALEAIREPGDLGERAKAGVIGAAAAGALPAAGSVLKRTMQGIKRTPAAQQLLNRGIPLTPAMAAPKGGAVEFTENIMANVPGVADKVAKQRLNALNAWNKSLLQEVAPPGAKITEVGTRGIQQIQGEFSKVYDKLWNTVGDIAPSASQGFKRLAQTARERLIPKHAKRVSNMLDNWNLQVNLARAAEKTGRQIDSLDDEIRMAIAKAKTPQEKAILENARQTLRKALPEGVDDGLKTIDGLYAKYKVVERAATQSRAARSGGVFTPDELTNAVRLEATRPQIAGGRARLQQQADVAQETIDRLIPAEGAGTLGQQLSIPAVAAGMIAAPKVVIPAVVAGRGAVTEPMRKLMTGGYDAMTKQGKLAAALKFAKYSGPASVGVMRAIDEDEPRQPAAIYNPARR